MGGRAARVTTGDGAAGAVVGVGLTTATGAGVLDAAGRAVGAGVGTTTVGGWQAASASSPSAVTR